ncbi:MAG: hypothetical protein ACK4VN_07320 [Bacteroidales bacterium]
MIRNLLFLTLTLIFVLTGREVWAQRFHGGIRAGLVASEVSGDNLGGPNKLGWHAAVYTYTTLSSVSSLRLEIMLIEKGSRAVPSERNDFREYLFRLQYVEVPLLWVGDVSSFSSVGFAEKLQLVAGLSASVLVGYQEEEFGTPVPSTGRQPFHPAELNILLGITHPLGERLMFHFGFSNSLTPIRPHMGGGKTWYNRGQYNTAWTFGLGYHFW